jgi:predicted nucleotidyltransferase
MKINFSKYESIIVCLLFGSVARQDCDEDSDMDLCIICDDINFKRLQFLRKIIASKYNLDEKSICVYSKSVFKEIVLKGSLFAWHLKLESKLIYLRKGEKIFSEKLFEDIVPYVDYSKDLELYRLLLNDSKKSIRDNGINEFDLAQLFTIARNTCMLLCYYKGMPKFGRKDVYLTLLKRYKSKFPIKRMVYNALLNWKLCYSRRKSLTTKYPSNFELTRFIKQIDGLLIFINKELNARTFK